jgi:acetyl-CoA C-acetyltransferase
VDLAAEVLNALVDRAKLDPALVEDVIMGCVVQAGEQSANIARHAVLASNLPISVPGASLDRACGSSQQAMHFAAATVMSGQMDIVIAAGVESMSHFPVPAAPPPTPLSSNSPKSPGYRARWGDGINQFRGAEMLTAKHGFSRDALDRFAYESHRRAIAATQSGAFEPEILPIEITQADGAREWHRVDEGIRFDITLEGVRSLKSLAEGGAITAATSSQICDGASGVIIASARAVKQYGLSPLARFHQMGVSAGDPDIMLEEPLFATDRALARCGMKIEDALDNGMIIGKARAFVYGAAACFRYYAGWTTKIHGQTNPSTPDVLNYTVREPLGVCALIIPWNVPISAASMKIAPALSCGNTVILKPAEQTPLSALALGQIILDAGIPPERHSRESGIFLQHDEIGADLKRRA